MGEGKIRKFVGSKEAAEILGCTIATLHHRVARKEIPHFRVNSFLIYDPEELELLIMSGRVEPVVNPKPGEAK